MLQGFAPVVAPNVHTMLPGSFPGEASLEAAQYFMRSRGKTRFCEVQTICKARDRGRGTMNDGRKGQRYNIFQGTARCGYCGSSMHIRRKPGINTGFLHCAGVLRGTGCVGVSYLIQRLKDVGAQVNDLKKPWLELQSEVQLLSNITRDETESLEISRRLMEQLEPKETDLDEKPRLRFRMLSEVQKVVRRLDLFPGGQLLAAGDIAIKQGHVTEGDLTRSQKARDAIRRVMTERSGHDC